MSNHNKRFHDFEMLAARAAPPMADLRSLPVAAWRNEACSIAFLRFLEETMHSDHHGLHTPSLIVNMED